MAPQTAASARPATVRLAGFGAAVSIQILFVALLGVQVASRYRPPAHDPLPLMATLIGDSTTLGVAEIEQDDVVALTDFPAVSMDAPEIDALGADPVAYIGPRYTDAPAPADPWIDSRRCEEVRRRLDALVGQPPGPALRADVDACLWKPGQQSTGGGG